MKKLIPSYRLATTNLNLLEMVLVFGILVLLVAGFTPVWTQTAAPTNNAYAWIASSADGKIVCAINSYRPALLSTNGGKTWTTNGTPTAAYGIAISADGTKLIMSAISNNQSYIIVSTNAGNTWTQTILPGGEWLAVASSADGAKLFAANSVGFIYASTNSGVTWNTNSAFSKNWTSIACSADGKRVVAAARVDKIYASTDSGMNWTPTSAPIKYWQSICSSSDGRILAATAGDGTSISTNCGSSWITTNIFGTSIACSADGTKLVVAGSLTGGINKICISADSGMTWATNNALGYCYGVASSSDGCKLWAVDVYFSGIWVGQTTPSPELKIQPTGGKFAFSWIVPSTNFVLQQNLDLTTTNWVTLTNAPTLNLTNLHDGITLSPSNGDGFFRLSTPP
jgi:photosystem II stability/assembly factor-like uncharacterized protein